MLIVPYRVKNPWKHFPVATVCIIALNVIVFLCTTEDLNVTDSAIAHYALTLGDSPFYTFFTAMFLHAEIMHIAGNMLFFWVFAPSVEDRLGIPRFLILYFSAGIIGDILQGLLDIMLHGQTIPGLGASGCIMGVMGAYWYLYSWSKVCIFYWFFVIVGVWEVAAIWVMGFFLAENLVEGYLSKSAGGGVANFCHLGGLGAGALFCMAMRMKRDSGQVSDAKAVQSEVKHLEYLPLAELEVLHRDEPQNAEILRAMIQPALRKGRTDTLEKAFVDVGQSLVADDPDLAAWYLLKLHGNPTLYTPAQLLRIGKQCEGTPDPAEANDVYDLLIQNFPQAPEIEMALYRMALTYRDHLRDPVNARVCLQELLQRYPFGSLESHARQLLSQMG